MQQMQEKMNARLEQWKVEREEAKIKKELAKLQELPDVPEDGSLFPDPPPSPAPIFLDYENPDRALVRPSSGKKSSLTISGGLPMDELPTSVSEFTNTVAIDRSAADEALPSHQGTPTFRDDVAPPASTPALATDIVNAWAQALAPIVPGAALPPPVLPTSPATSPSATTTPPSREKAAILARLTAEQFNTAAAFAGRPSGSAVETKPPRTSEDEHHQEADANTVAASPVEVTAQ